MRVLIISTTEILYNPRLLKAADFLTDKGVEVTVFNTIVGNGSKVAFDTLMKNKSWKFYINDISKRTIASKCKWLYVSLYHKLLTKIFKNHFSNKYFLNKALIGISHKVKGQFDYILINLIDSLPLAVEMKKRYNAKLIYDSQEYFIGQYEKYEKNKLSWVKSAESAYISDVDILITTTNVMGQKLKNLYNLSIPIFRVRNTPSKVMWIDHNYSKINDSKVSYAVWHGMSINLNNTRGVHILLEAIALCKSNVELILQGNISDKEKGLLDACLVRLSIQNKVHLKKAAEPYSIVNSISTFDIGLLGELGEEENQLLTSSNKLFDYIHAGLAVISPDLPGLNETIVDNNLGITYETGNPEALAEAIDYLVNNRNILKEYKAKSDILSKSELFWENDYENVWNEMIKHNRWS